MGPLTRDNQPPSLCRFKSLQNVTVGDGGTRVGRNTPVGPLTYRYTGTFERRRKCRLPCGTLQLKSHIPQANNASDFPGYEASLVRAQCLRLSIWTYIITFSHSEGLKKFCNQPRLDVGNWVFYERDESTEPKASMMICICHWPRRRQLNETGEIVQKYGTAKISRAEPFNGTRSS